MTKYEIARILGVRTKQINSGANIFVKTSENILIFLILKGYPTARKFAFF